MADNYELILEVLEKMKESTDITEAAWENHANLYMQKRLEYVMKQTSSDDAISDALEHFAMICFEQVVSKNPRNKQGWWELALLYTFSKTRSDTEKAFACFKKCAELEPTNSSYWSQIYHIAAQNTEFDQEHLAILKQLMKLTREMQNDEEEDFDKLIEISNLALELGMNVILRPLESRVQKIVQLAANPHFGLTPEELLNVSKVSQNSPLLFNQFKNQLISNRPSFHNPYRKIAPAETLRTTPHP